MTPEGRNLAYAKKKARLLGMVPLRMSFRAGIDAGWPDLLILGIGGRALWMEVKAEGGKTSPIQEARLQHLRNYGHSVVVVSTKDEIDNALIDFGADRA